MAVCLDEAAKSVRSIHRNLVATLQLLKPVSQQVGLANANARLDDRRQKDLIHGLLHGLYQVHGFQNVILGRVGIQMLQEDGACHLVGSDTNGLHLCNNLPDLSTRALLLHRGIDQLIESDAVRLQTCQPHLLHQAPGFVKVVVEQMGLDQCVERHDIGHLGLFCPLHPGLSRLQVVALHTGVQDSVVNNAVQINAALFQ
mmetsp:Transcript_126671/g.236743  ORF Transcript_126671/g.236743 Transcript_126671/m.236743 type:complete len:200 (+) Transcript_126671:1250-1849(+)